MKRIILIFLAATAAFSCHKSANRTTAIDFSWTSVANGTPPYANLYKFAFATTASAASTTTWDFGDGSTASTDFAPTHTYSAVSTYTVTLIVNGDAAHAISKALNVGLFLPHSFTWAGVPFTDSVVVFRSNVPSDSSFNWNFGDGTTSTDSTPSHVFHTAGTYSVTLTVNSHAASSVTEQVTIANDPVYTHAMAGMRVWHDTGYLFLSAPSTTAYPHPDASFALSIISDAEVAFNGRSTYYQPYYSNDSLLYFSSGYTDNTGNTHSLTIWFYHYTNRIHMQQYDRIGAGGYQIEDWKTP